MKTTNERLFLALYTMLSLYFSSIMVRLMLVAAPGSCIMTGIAISEVIRRSMEGIRSLIYFVVNGTKTKKRMIPVWIGVLLIALMGYFCCITVFHGSWTGSQVYSSPSIIMCKLHISFLTL